MIEKRMSGVMLMAMFMAFVPMTPRNAMYETPSANTGQKKNMKSGVLKLPLKAISVTRIGTATIATWVTCVGACVKQIGRSTTPIQAYVRRVAASVSRTGLRTGGMRAPVSRTGPVNEWGWVHPSRVRAYE